MDFDPADVIELTSVGATFVLLLFGLVFSYIADENGKMSGVPSFFVVVTSIPVMLAAFVVTWRYFRGSHEGESSREQFKSVGHELAMPARDLKKAISFSAVTGTSSAHGRPRERNVIRRRSDLLC